MKNVISGLALLVAGAAFLLFTRPSKSLPLPATNEQTNTITQIAANLEIPWALDFLPDGSFLVTERVGRIVLIDSNGTSIPVGTIDEVLPIGEGGLLGLALHPNFDINRFIYVYYTYSSSGEGTFNRVVRYSFQNNVLTDRQVIVDKIPGSRNHNGGRIRFGPDNYLYIGTGDAQHPSLAQNTNSLAGKILRVTDDGQPAPGNPFQNQVYSYGHRNVQGLAWDDQSRLWATEHGPSGNDELNLIESGGNYGWPIIQGDQQQQGMHTPVIHSGNTTWAPAGLVYSQGKLYFAGLRAEALFVYDPSQENIDLRIKNEYGRLREALLDPSGKLYISTSNRDGRGRPATDDDKILWINQEQL